jgi:hypothetical protein
MTKLLELTKLEKRIIRERLGTSVTKAVRALFATREWAVATGSVETFEAHFPSYAEVAGFGPVLADLARDYVLSQTYTEEEQELNHRGFALVEKNTEDWTEADKQTWAAFTASIENLQMTASEEVFALNAIKRDTPLTQKEIWEGSALAYLRDWSHTQIN